MRPLPSRAGAVKASGVEFRVLGLGRVAGLFSLKPQNRNSRVALTLPKWVQDLGFRWLSASNSNLELMWFGQVYDSLVI